MGIYTAYDLPAVDATIEAHMQTLQRLCSAHLGRNFDSLILSGSFGRGEGVVLKSTPSGRSEQAKEAHQSLR